VQLALYNFCVETRQSKPGWFLRIVRTLTHDPNVYKTRGSSCSCIKESEVKILCYGLWLWWSKEGEVSWNRGNCELQSVISGHLRLTQYQV
jgi:hypothetical protein